MNTIKVEGLAELKAALEKLPIEIQRNALKGAVLEAAKVVQQEARQKAPVDEGTLKRAIYKTISKSLTTFERAVAIVGVRYGRRFRRRGQDAWYFPFVEFGTSKMSARPFMRPAFEATIDRQIEAMRQRLADAITAAAAKLRYDPPRR